MEKLIYDLQKLGIQKGDNLLVHASFKSLGIVAGGPESVISSLLESIGANGTLLMPTLSYETVTESKPVFNVIDTPSCVGALTEYFRQRTGTLRSLHPTHSISSYGGKAVLFIKDHEQDNTPVGPNSPLSKLKDVHGKILFIGCGLWPNTSMHGVEEFAKPEYLFNGEVTFNIIDTKGKLNQYKHITHGFNGWKQRYDRIENILNEYELKKGRVLEADCYLMDSHALWNKASEKLKEDPIYFVELVVPHIN